MKRSPFDVGVVLAAGASSRMGRPKALLPDGAGATFLERVVQRLREGGCRAILVVVGRHAGPIAEALPRDALLVRNDRWEEGQLSSARRGLEAAFLLGAQRIVLQPVDQPMLAARDVRQVLARTRGKMAVVSAWQGQPGHPLGVSRGLTAAILADSESPTLREAIANNASRILAVEGSRGSVLGANTPGELRALRAAARGRGSTPGP